MWYFKCRSLTLQNRVRSLGIDPGKDEGNLLTSWKQSKLPAEENRKLFNWKFLSQCECIKNVYEFQCTDPKMELLTTSDKQKEVL